MKSLIKIKCLYHHKSMKSMKDIKTTVPTVIELAYKVFDYVQSFICVGWKI